MLSRRTLPIRNLRTHWRSNLPVLAGVAIGTAVLLGALLVGDSLRGSLATKAARQLNGIRSAWIGTRFVRQELAGDSTPAILLRGTVEAGDRRATNVTVVGLPRTRTLFPGVAPADGATLSHRLAHKLSAKVGDPIRVTFEKPSKIPRSSFVGNRSTDDITLSLRSVVSATLPSLDPANEFSLRPAAGAPLVIYLPLDLLASRLNQSGKANAILSEQSQSRPLGDVGLGDRGLTVRTEHVQPQGRKVKDRELPYLSLESDRFVIDRETMEAAERFVKGRPGWRIEPTVSYLAIALTANGKEIPYSIISGVNPSAESPLGPFLPAGVSELRDDEIALVDWPASPLRNLKPGDPVELAYFQPEIEADYVEIRKSFRLAGYIPFAGPTVDPSLTPQFPGITDKLTVRDWKPPFKYDSTKIKPNDVHELFWQDYRTTPKAYVNRATAEKLFASRYGTATSLRLAPPPGISMDIAAEELSRGLLRELDSAAGFSFEQLAERFQAASKGGQDFGGLFLGFSVFLIVAALLLIGLLVRLATERRGREIGLLLAVGYQPGQVRSMLLAEGLLISIVGSVIGGLIAVPYARLLLRALIGLWPDDSISTFLSLHVSPTTIAIGVAAGIATAMVAIALAVRKLVTVSPPQLLRGTTQTPESSQASPRITLPIVSALMAVALISAGFVLKHPDAQAGCFFGSGALLLIAGLSLLRNWLRGIDHRPTRTRNAFAIRNARANPGRSLMTVSLVALATFLVIAVESFRRPVPPPTWLGATHLVECDVPLFQPFDRGPGLDDLLTNLEKRYVESPTERSTAERLSDARQRLIGMTAVPLRSHEGDDASCLNLYKAGQPGVIGFPSDLFDRIRPGVPAETNEGPGALVEQNSLQWMLKKSVGDTIVLPNGRGQDTAFKIVGSLTDSPFQSELIIAERSFKKLYPTDEGFRRFLLTMPRGDVSDLLEAGFSANGLTVTSIRERITGYQAVIGAYLTLFQLLGAFGLLLGVAGLVVVIIRGVWERSAELALLRAIGFNSSVVKSIVLAENAALLTIGVGVGLLAALGSVAPHAVAGGSIPVLRVATMTFGFLAVGLVASWIATSLALRRPLIAGLRSE
jgi:putative ABC transport system permease protein